MTRPPQSVHARSVLGRLGTFHQDLLTAAMHSRSVYGYITAFTGSITQFLISVVVQRFHFDVINGPSAAAHLEAVCRLTGLDFGDIFAANWRSNVYRPSFYFAVDRASKCLVLTVRCVLVLALVCTLTDTHERLQGYLATW